MLCLGPNPIGVCQPFASRLSTCGRAPFAPLAVGTDHRGTQLEDVSVRAGLQVFP